MPPARARPPRPVRPAKRRPDRYHHGDLRRALVLEALRTIHVEGASALTLRGVGDRLGVSRTALYRHFADKQALLNEVAAEGFRLLRTALRDAWGRGGRVGFDEMGQAYVAFAVAHPSHYRVMFGGLAEAHQEGAEGSTEGTDAFQVLVDAIVAEQAAGRVRRDDPLPLALHIWATVHGIAMLALDGLLSPPMTAESLARQSIAWLHVGIDR
ncbi:MAG: TetR/AcrR family transcriptional regulator [Vicinamibacteraceae bacterium]